MLNGTTVIGPRGNSYLQYEQTHLFSGILRTQINQRGLLLCGISVKGDVPSDGFLLVPEPYFLTLFCYCPFRPTPAYPLELQNLFPLRRLDFSCSRVLLTSYHVQLQPHYMSKCMHTQNLCIYTLTCLLRLNHSIISDFGDNTAS